MTAIAFVNTKGGVGKTTTCVHFCYWLSAKKRKKIAIIDADGQRLTSKWLLAMNFPGSLLHTTDPDLITDKIPEFEADADFVIVDCAANSYEQTRSALLRADLAIIPTAPTGVDLEACGDAVLQVKRIQSIRGGLPNAALFINKGRKGTRLLQETQLLLHRLASEHRGIKALKQTIWIREAIADAYQQEKTVWQYPGASETAQEYDSLFKEILQLL